MMADVTIKPEKFAQTVGEILKEHRDLTDKALHTAVDRTAKETVSITKRGAPVKTGRYKKGWNSQKTTDNGRGGYGRTVYNRKRYMIAHLLQNGHGGPRPARAFPHIPSDDETEKLFMKEMERAMK